MQMAERKKGGKFASSGSACLGPTERRNNHTRLREGSTCKKGRLIKHNCNRKSHLVVSFGKVEERARRNMGEKAKLRGKELQKKIKEAFYRVTQLCT